MKSKWTNHRRLPNCMTTEPKLMQNLRVRLFDNLSERNSCVKRNTSGCLRLPVLLCRSREMARPINFPPDRLHFLFRKPRSTTYTIPSIVKDVSAMFVDTTTFLPGIPPTDKASGASSKFLLLTRHNEYNGTTFTAPRFPRYS